MSDSDKTDPPLCPVHGKKCFQEEQIVAIEDKLEEIVASLRTLNSWAPTVDKGMERIFVQHGEVAAGIEDAASGVRRLTFEVGEVKDNVEELQMIVKNGNGKGKR